MTLAGIIASFGINADAWLGQGGESTVFALDQDRILRVNHNGNNQAHVNCRSALLSELAHTAGQVSFAIPHILEAIDIEGHVVTIERRLPGRPMMQLLAELKGEARAVLVRSYLKTAVQIADLAIHRPWYGDLCHELAVQAPTFRAYLEQRARHSLQAAGYEFSAVDAAQLAAALPEPDGPALVHLDAFPGNMLAEGETITAVLDFGVTSIIGDGRFNPLVAAIYLDPPITPPANDRDRAVAQEWLADNDLAILFEPARNWIAAYWSFAQDDIMLYRWCRSILLP